MFEPANYPLSRRILAEPTPERASHVRGNYAITSGSVTLRARRTRVLLHTLEPARWEL
jgi:hypothetical protein